MKLIDGNKVARQLKHQLSDNIALWRKKGGKKPVLTIILVGNNPSSEVYVKYKIKDSDEVGIDGQLLRFPDTISEEELLSKIEQINANETIDGLIVQLPLPIHISENKVLQLISHKKDVDGFHPVNIGRMALNLPSYLPATPKGITELLSSYNIETTGKHCVVVGRSNIVGTPISILLSRKSQPGNATVTLCHSRTENLQSFTQQADILITALGSPEFIKADMVKENAVVIDVGTTRIKSETTKSGWQLKGDICFDEVAPKCSFITPVPGGVGPLTRVSLLTNTFLATQKIIYK